MSKLIFFCKSYLGDINRFERFWASLQKHNVENIPFFACVPEKDLDIFKEKISNSLLIQWITDEKVVEMSPGGNIEIYRDLSPSLSQQIIKSEAWRVLEIENYVCFDSDSVVIRDLGIKDFLSQDGAPYTVMHQHKMFWELSLKRSEKYLNNYLELSEKIKSFFDRSGPDFNFGPTPCIWSKNVWKDLYEKTLKPSGRSFWDAIIEIPSEIMWYGEAILEHKSIPLIPIDPLMKAYLYPWQLKGSYKLPKKKLAKIYIGVVYQSNWEFELNYIEKKKFFSRILRSLKRFLKRI